MLLELLQERLSLIAKFKDTFVDRYADKMADRFPRGPLQRKLCKIHNLPLTGPNQRAVNDAMKSLGYVKITLNGRSFYKKVVS